MCALVPWNRVSLEVGLSSSWAPCRHYTNAIHVEMSTVTERDFDFKSEH